MDEIDRAAKKNQRAKAAAATAFEELKTITVKAITEDGLAESEAARRAGVDRMTVRKWLGKR